MKAPLTSAESDAIGRLAVLLNEPETRSALAKIASAGDLPPRHDSRSYLDVHEAVGYLRLSSRDALYRRIRSGAIPAWCFSRLGRQYRFLRGALDELLDARAKRRVLRGPR